MDFKIKRELEVIAERKERNKQAVAAKKHNKTWSSVAKSWLEEGLNLSIGHI